MTDRIRVLRVLEYEGPRGLVESTIERSIQGLKEFGKLTIRAATVGNYPEILTQMDEVIDDNE